MAVGNPARPVRLARCGGEPVERILQIMNRSVVVRVGIILVLNACLVCAGSSGAAAKKSLLVQKALELLRLSIHCPLPPCNFHCGISSDYSSQKYSGDKNTFKVVIVDNMLKANTIRTVSAKYKDLQIDPPGKGDADTLPLSCSRDRDCIHVTQEVQCAVGYDCLESTQLDGKNVKFASEYEHREEMSFCDKKRAEYATRAIRILMDAAPSFDCGEATSSVEKAICADPSLASKDRTLTKLYVAARRILQPSARQHLLRTERTWLKLRDDCAGSDMDDCIGTLYDLRIRQLQLQTATR